MNDLEHSLCEIGLRATAEALNDMVARATQKRWGPTELLENVVRAELADRSRKSLERRMKRSRIGAFKPIADFDWAWPTAIERDDIEHVLGLDFISQARNVVLIAAQGLGKTMIAKNIAHAAVQGGHTVLFTTAAQMLLDLGSQDSARGLERRLKYYSGMGVLVCDEIGYLSYDSRNADLFFQVISRRYEKKSLVLTTNLAFSDWATVFPNASCVTAMIDRIVHHADIIGIEGESYRKREAEQDDAKRGASKRTKRQPPAGPKSRGK